MHGRLKVRTSAEQAEAKKLEQQKNLKKYLAVTSKIFSKREAGEHDEEALECTGILLEKNPDFYTLWNYRREVLIALKSEKSEEELKKLILFELDLTQNCLKANPKSYATWHHRSWAMDFNPEADWKKELKLCNFFLSQDERNFHCWDYRRHVAKKCNVSPEEELKYTTELIETNFSNYSAWHYRSKLLPLVHQDVSKNALKEEILLKEFDLIQNAAFTDPDDQSVWFYHRWLLGRSKMPLQILNVCVYKPQNLVAVLLSEPVKVEDNLTLEINRAIVPVSWKPVNSDFSISTIWKCELPFSIEDSLGAGDNIIEACVSLRGGKECCSLLCEINGNKSFYWKNSNRADMFRAELSDSTKDVLERELESCKQLNELEPNSKWTLFTCVLLMRALNNTKFEKEIEDFMEKLTKVDSARKNYYKDLGSKFIIEDTIERLPIKATEVNLSNRHLTSLYHFDQLILIEAIDLSANNLESVNSLGYLIFVKRIVLDDNQLTSLEGIKNLQSLEFLSVKRNSITRTSSLEALTTCSSLQQLFLEGNPVVNEAEYVPTVKTLPALKLADNLTL